MAYYSGFVEISFSTGAYDQKAWEIKQAILQRAVWEAFGPTAVVDYVHLFVEQDFGEDGPKPGNALKGF